MEVEQKQENLGATPTAVTTPAEPSATAVVAAVSDEDLGKVRGLVLQAHPDVVPDLVTGGSIDELLASVEPARVAYQQIAEKVRGSHPTVTTTETVTTTGVVTPPVVPAGGTAAVVDPAVLGPTTKIAQALAARKRR
jgi:hypothetical protein